ncbi:MAG: TIGR04283 family arsenosugar biosynthesis glycosyltransferase, partial [Rhodovibrionaceae bacterium]
MPPSLSIVIPAYREGRRLPAALAPLTGVIAEGGKIVVADGGSKDQTAAVARQAGAEVVLAPKGRGLQLRAGAAKAQGEWLLFLHADTRLDQVWRTAAETFMADPANARRAAVFRFVLDEPAPQARRVERLGRWRARSFGLPYGDQGLLISRAFYDELGGYRPLPLMEDVDLVRRIGKRRLVELPVDARTSAARY